MTTQDKSKAIIEAIQKAIPELMELKFGCKLRHYREILTVVDGEESEIYYTNGEGYKKTIHAKCEACGEYWLNCHFDRTKEKKDFEILGSPITLHYVLAACFSEGIITKEDLNDLTGLWNFSKPDNLQDQLKYNPELVELLYSLLT